MIPPLGSVVALGLIDPWLVAAFAVGFPALAVVLRTLVRDSSAVSAGYGRAQGAIAARLLDALAGAHTIAAAGTQARERERVLGPLPLLREYGYASWRVQARAAAQAMTVAPALQIIVVAVAGVELARHRITTGDLVAASQYAVLAVGVGASVGVRQPAGPRARRRKAGRRAARPTVPALRRARPAGRAAPCGSRRATADRHHRPPRRRGGAARPRPRRPAWRRRRRGRPVRAGKSTLARLAGRLADPDEGAVTLDGTACASSPASLRGCGGGGGVFERPELVGDTPVTSSGSESDAPTTPRSGWPPRPEPRPPPSSPACPGGSDTPLDGTPLSGGEVQRLGLARAFAHAGAARLLVLDDATSSLDTVTEMLVGRAIAGELSGLTRLIVAHRATTAARADLVAWLDGGRIRALAPHGELWADPEYRAIFGAADGAGEAC